MGSAHIGVADGREPAGDAEAGFAMGGRAGHGARHVIVAAIRIAPSCPPMFRGRRTCSVAGHGLSCPRPTSSSMLQECPWASVWCSWDGVGWWGSGVE